MDKVIAELDRTNREIEQPDFWNNAEYARKVMTEKSRMEQTIQSYEKMETGLRDIEEMIELCEMEEDEDTADAIVEDFEKYKEELENLRISTLLTGKYDKSNAILSIHAGAGGVEAMD
ncbi:MAG: PCRF domain-containing protein, partial [Firmicutes bacterium]|nr:PCRF domain-containing protein [Bacillota bacterium]